MYALTVQSNGSSQRITSQEIQRALAELVGDYSAFLAPVAMRHLSAIEHIEARGIAYANQDFDVLSAAWSFVVG